MRGVILVFDFRTTPTAKVCIASLMYLLSVSDVNIMVSKT